MKHAQTKKSVFLLLPLGMSIRNFLYTDFIKEMVKEFQLVIYSGFSKDKQFTDQHNDPNFIHRELTPAITNDPVYRIGAFLYSHFFEINRQHLARKTQNQTMVTLFLRDLNPFWQEKWVFFYARFLFWTLPLINFLTTFLLARSSFWSSELEQFKPSLIVSTHPFSFACLPVTLAANKLKIKTAGIIHSWDNVSSKGKLLANFDLFLVWGQQQLDHFNHYCSNKKNTKVVICGVPQYDQHLTGGNKSTKSEFFTSLDIESDRKLITYICNGPGRFFRIENQVQIIYDIIESLDAIKIKYALFIRLNPHYVMNEINQLKDTPYGKIIQQRPGAAFSALGALKETTQWDSNSNEVNFYGSLMKHSNLVVCVASTALIDSLVFETPVINALYEQFDGEKASTLRFYEKYHHLVPLVKSPAVFTIHSKEEMKNKMNQVLIKGAKPPINEINKICNYICGPKSSTSSKKMAQEIIEFWRSTISL